VVEKNHPRQVRFPTFDARRHTQRSNGNVTVRNISTTARSENRLATGSIQENKFQQNKDVAVLRCDACAVSAQRAGRPQPMRRSGQLWVELARQQATQTGLETEGVNIECRS